jgi:AraC family transcriptional regulator
MLLRESRSEYERRMHRMLAHIDDNLDQPLDLASLAEVAHFSPFHFHRLFAAWIGETLGDYLRRRRVEVAAMRLASQPKLTILLAALSVGFGSGEAFSRAFRGRFGQSPTAWRIRHAREHRSNRNRSQVISKGDQAYSGLGVEDVHSQRPQPETFMKVQLIDRQPASVAYLRHLGPYGESLSKFWQQTYYPWAATNNLLGQARYGISHDDPSITVPNKCRYDACAEVPADFVATGGAVKTTIPGGRYAISRFHGVASQMIDAWNELLREWLPSSGMQLDARPCFEYYPKEAQYDSTTGTLECDICIPIAPL